MIRRRLLACLVLAIFGLGFSGVALEWHHPDCHDQSADCRTCYLLTIGRTAVVETPELVIISDQAVHSFASADHTQPRVVLHHIAAAPRAPPAC